MPTKSKSTKRRTKVRDIPQSAKALNKREQKQVKGGAGPGDEGPEETVTFVFQKLGAKPLLKTK